MTMLASEVLRFEGYQYIDLARYLEYLRPSLHWQSPRVWDSLKMWPGVVYGQNIDYAYACHKQPIPRPCYAAYGAKARKVRASIHVGLVSELNDVIRSYILVQNSLKIQVCLTCIALMNALRDMHCLKCMSRQVLHAARPRDKG